MSSAEEDTENELARLLWRTTPHAVVAIDTTQHIRLFNRAAERLFGYESSELKGAPLDWLIPDDMVQQHKVHLDAFVSSGQRARWMRERTAIRARHRTGREIIVQAAIVRLPTEPEPLFAAVIEDIASQHEQQQAIARLLEILESTPDLVAMADQDARVTYLNAAGRNILGIPEDLDAAEVDIGASHPEWSATRLFQQAFPQAAEFGMWRGEMALRNHLGEEIPVDQVVIAHHGNGGTVQRFSTIARDLSGRKRMEATLRQQARALEQTADMVWIVSTSGQIVYVNEAFKRITGYDSEEAIGERPGELLSSAEHAGAFDSVLRQSADTGVAQTGVFKNRRKDGSPIYTEETIAPVISRDGAVECFVATGRDITDRVGMERRLQDLAYRDQLTGLNNRVWFHESLEEMLKTAHAGDAPRPLAVLFLDLDNFKAINDALGHRVGDEILERIGARIRAVLDDRNVVARYGGDEFAILIPNVSDEARLLALADQLHDALATPSVVSGYQFDASISMGIATCPHAGQTADDLIQAADTAMYQAKTKGGGQTAYYTPVMSERAYRKFRLLESLPGAGTRGELRVLLQPLFDVHGQQLVAAEALLRWSHPHLGEVSPREFIPAAEEGGSINQIGVWMLETVCREIHGWRAAGLNPPPVTVNISAVQLDDPAFVHSVRDLLAEYELTSGHLVFELTESVFVGDDKDREAALIRLRGLGVSLAIDDFGTGYCSLAYLRRLPADWIKVAREFIQGLPEHQDNRAVLQSIQSLGQALGSKVVAEGIETQQEHEWVRRIGIDAVQGYFFARPMTAEDLAEQWLGSSL
ncbi:EAL domain-containing protein [Aquisalimonas sp.]|uniref:sensor domain-containing protein n=1 Tax=unclassified Aquisalimonas TaxID=2644645 RepID=UPI0025C45443|nr:EAL domain-containing protein [Aquisalimonas sp.]